MNRILHGEAATMGFSIAVRSISKAWTVSSGYAYTFSPSLVPGARRKADPMQGSSKGIFEDSPSPTMLQAFLRQSKRCE